MGVTNISLFKKQVFFHLMNIFYLSLSSEGEFLIGPSGVLPIPIPVPEKLHQQADPYPRGALGNVRFFLHQPGRAGDIQMDPGTTSGEFA
jgi:hypothetical protein